MNFKDLQKELKAIKGVSNLTLIRQNVIKVDIEQSVSKAFFTKLKEDFYFEHCSLITAVDNQPITVNLTLKFEGNSKVWVAVGAAAVDAKPLLLLKGKAAVVEQGSVFEATVISNREIKLTN